MKKKSAAARARFLSDPVDFQKHQLCRRLWQKQCEILKAVESCPLVAVKGCHASGKTFAAAGLPLWWLARHRTRQGFHHGAHVATGGRRSGRT